MGHMGGWRSGLGHFGLLCERSLRQAIMACYVKPLVASVAIVSPFLLACKDLNASAKSIAIF